jgi:hypothetical protein
MGYLYVISNFPEERAPSNCFKIGMSAGCCNKRLRIKSYYREFNPDINLVYQTKEIENETDKERELIDYLCKHSDIKCFTGPTGFTREWFLGDPNIAVDYIKKFEMECTVNSIKELSEANNLYDDDVISYSESEKVLIGANLPINLNSLATLIVREEVLYFLEAESSENILHYSFDNCSVISQKEMNSCAMNLHEMIYESKKLQLKSLYEVIVMQLALITCSNVVKDMKDLSVELSTRVLQLTECSDLLNYSQYYNCIIRRKLPRNRQLYMEYTETFMKYNYEFLEKIWPSQ